MTTAHNSSEEENRYFNDPESGAEMARLIDQDRLITRGMGGLLPERDGKLAGIRRILDIGCGPGGWALEIAFASPDIEVVGFDISRTMIDYASALARVRKIKNVSFHVMDAQQPLNFPDDAFDLVNARFLAFLGPSVWPKLMQECKRITKAGGTIRLTESEWAMTNSSSHEQVYGMFYRAMKQVGQSYSPDGRIYDITPMLGGFLRGIGCRALGHKGKRQNSEENLAERSSVGYADEKSLPDEECFMNCPHCASMATREQSKRTCLGYRIFRCSACQRTFNERTATLFNFLEYPTDIVLLVVLWRLRYKLSLRDLAEMFLERGWEFTHETVRDWEVRFAPLLADQLRTKRRGQASQSWYVDETYVKVHGQWCYLYRAIDRDGNLVDSMLSEKRNMDAAKRFFRQTLETIGHAPERVTTDGHDSYPRAIRETLGRDVLHRTNLYLNNLVEQDHRGIKQRYYPMRGFGNFASAAHFCRALAQQRDLFRQRLDTFKALVLRA